MTKAPLTAAARRRLLTAVVGTLAIIGGLVGTAVGMPSLTPAADSASSSARTGDLGFTLERLGGSNRYEVAVGLSQKFFSGGATTVVIASGEIFSDGMAAGPMAAKLGAPVLFVRRDSVIQTTRDELRRLRPARIYVLGGPATIADAVVTELGGLATSGAKRVSGVDRFATAAAASAEAFAGGAEIAYVASGLVWPDALAGGAAATVQSAPMLLTDDTTLSAATRAELRRLAPKRIMLLGGTSSVGPDVATALAAIAPTERLSGPDRYAVALAVSARVFGTDRPGVMVATGSNFPDSLAAGAAAAYTRGPILLARGSSLPSGMTSELTRLGPDTAYLLGGTASVPAAVARMVQKELGVCWSGEPPSDTTAEAIATGPNSGGRIAFTLDMGGRMEGAADIVRYLTANQVCTTFFPTSIMADTSEGREVMALIAAHPELFEIGNHTVHHCDLVRGGGGSPTSAPCARTMTSDFIRAELTGAEVVLRRLSQLPVRPYWRPPYGSFDSRVAAIAKSAGYPKTMLWSRDTIDWDPATSAQDIIDDVTTPTPVGGTIVLAHLGGYHTGEALPVIVDTLRARGLTFTTISDVLDR